MNTEKKKRISIGITPDVFEKIERINQNERHGYSKAQSIMLGLIDLGFVLVESYGSLDTALLVTKHEVKDQKHEPAIIPSHGFVLEFPLGKRLSAG